MFQKPIRRISKRRKEEPVELEMEDGSVRAFIVREMMGDQRESFMAVQANKVKYDKKGRIVGVKEVGGATAALLSRTLFDPTAGRYLTEEEIEALKLPASALFELVELASQLSGMADDDANDLGN